MIFNISEIESERLLLQQSFDNNNSQERRRRLGQFGTPIQLANELLETVKELMPKHRRIRFFDPAFGTGALYSALLTQFPNGQIQKAAGCEKDEKIGVEARRLWEPTGLTLEIIDFTALKPPKTLEGKYNLLISNPPYVRHQYLDQSDKIRLRELVRKEIGIEINGRTGLHGYFILLSDSWLATNGTACWIVPSEILEVQYGKEILNYLLNCVTLQRIHRFETTDLQFDSALVSSIIIIYKKAKPSSPYEFPYSQGGTLLKPKTTKTLSVDQFKESPRQRESEAISKEFQQRISDFFEVKRGIATGANSFFIMSVDDVKKFRIPKKYLVPILPPPRYVTVDRIESSKGGIPALEKKLHLISCDLSEEKVRREAPNLWKYFEMGRSIGLNERYLCRRRVNWYSQEKRDIPMFVIPYMSRIGKSTKQGFRFILNESRAIATNSYILLYPKPWLRKITEENPEVKKVLWTNLNEIPRNHFTNAGRVYAGKLWKLEPSELKSIPFRIDSIVTKAQRNL